MPSWDNTPRQPIFSDVFVGESPDLFRLWLSFQLTWTKLSMIEQENPGLVFINAWNEWAEGCHLEPDQYHGLEFLEKIPIAKAEAERRRSLFGFRDELADFEIQKFEEASLEERPRRFSDLFSVGYLLGAARLLVRDPSGRLFYSQVRRFFALRSKNARPLWEPKHRIWVKSEAQIVQSNEAKLLMVIHIHYSMKLANFLTSVRALKVQFKNSDVILTYSQESLGNELNLIASQFGFLVVKVPNKGRNLGALMHVLREYTDWDYLLHLHTKKSTHMSSSRARAWRRSILSPLLSPKLVSELIQLMSDDSNFGLAYGDASGVLSGEGYSWTSNAKIARDLLAKMGLEFRQGKFPYPAGAMFLCAKKALQPVLSLDLGIEDMPSEPLPLDGALPHALERLVGYCSSELGLGHLVVRNGEIYADTSYINLDPRKE